MKKELLEYDKVAVLPFQGDKKGEVSDTFAENFREKFSRIELVKRQQVLEVFPEQDLYSDRLDEATRRKIGQVFDVQALIIGNLHYPSIFRWLLQIQVIDAGSGQVMGRSFVEINYLAAEGMREACRIAVENLRLNSTVDGKSLTSCSSTHFFPRQQLQVPPQQR